MRLLIIGSLCGDLVDATRVILGRGIKISNAGSVSSGVAMIKNGVKADMIMVDVAIDIARLIKSLDQHNILIPVIVCGKNSGRDKISAATAAGATGFVPLPLTNEAISKYFTLTTDDSTSVSDDFNLIHDSSAMAKLLSMAKKVAKSSISVLITGESGVGKEVLARFIHHNSDRRHQPFISVNCAAIPEQLLESELFGYEKGSFTGAIARRIGKFEEANNGTLLLDEISEMDVHLQAKLLRVIQERELDRIGSSKPITIDIRIIATSNLNLEQAVNCNKFRKDLFYRLNVINLRVPPLRQRPEDIKALSDYFIKKYCQLNGIGKRQLTPQALELLFNSPWPGNVRELENTIHRSLVLASDTIIEPQEILTPAGEPLITASAGQAIKTDFAGVHATLEMPKTGTTKTGTTRTEITNTNMTMTGMAMSGMTMAEMEKDHIFQTLDKCLGNRTKAAKHLGISIRTLRNKLKKYRQQQKEHRPGMVVNN